MTLIAIIAGILLVGSAGLQWAFAIYFKKSFDKLESTPLPQADQKKAAVVMSVRGCDPSLRASLLGVLDQAYADYSIFLIVDSQTDQAWDFVHQLKKDSAMILNLWRCLMRTLNRIQPGWPNYWVH